MRIEEIMHPDLTFWVNAMWRENRARRAYHKTERVIRDYGHRTHYPVALQDEDDFMNDYYFETGTMWLQVAEELAEMGIYDPEILQEIEERGRIVARALDRINRPPYTNDPTFTWILHGYVD